MTKGIVRKRCLKKRVARANGDGMSPASSAVRDAPITNMLAARRAVGRSTERLRILGGHAPRRVHDGCLSDCNYKQLIVGLASGTIATLAPWSNDLIREIVVDIGARALCRRRHVLCNQFILISADESAQFEPRASWSWRQSPSAAWATCPNATARRGDVPLVRRVPDTTPPHLRRRGRGVVDSGRAPSVARRCAIPRPSSGRAPRWSSSPKAAGRRKTGKVGLARVLSPARSIRGPVHWAPPPHASAASVTNRASREVPVLGRVPIPWRPRACGSRASGVHRPACCGRRRRGPSRRRATLRARTRHAGDPLGTSTTRGDPCRPRRRPAQADRFAWDATAERSRDASAQPVRRADLCVPRRTGIPLLQSSDRPRRLPNTIAATRGSATTP